MSYIFYMTRTVKVVRTKEFEKTAKKLLGADEIAQLVEYLATFPDAGSLIKGTAGARKLYWALPGTSKRSGSRVIYFHYSPDFVVYLFSIYSKADKADLTKREEKDLKDTITALKQAHKKRVRK